MSKAFSALQQFAVLIRVSFAAITKRPNNMRNIKNKIISLSCTRPHASSLFLQGSLATLMGPVSCQIIALLYPAHCHCLMVEAGLLWYSGSSQQEQKSVEAAYPVCQGSNRWLPVTFPRWELCHLANPPTAREPGKCGLAEHPRALLQAFSCEGRSQIRWLGFQKSPSQPMPFPPHNNFRPLCPWRVPTPVHRHRILTSSRP